jgi:hypothetical protein
VDDEFDIFIAGEKQKIRDAERESEELRILETEAKEAAKEEAINNFNNFFVLQLLKGISERLDSLNDGTFDHNNSLTVLMEESFRGKLNYTYESRIAEIPKMGEIEGMNYRKEYFIDIKTEESSKWGVLPATNSINDLFMVFEDREDGVDRWHRREIFWYRDNIEAPLLDGKAGILDKCAKIMIEMGISLSWDFVRANTNYNYSEGFRVGKLNFFPMSRIFCMNMNYSKVRHKDYFYGNHAEIMYSIKEKINRVHQKDIAKETEMAQKLQAAFDAKNKRKEKRKEQVNKIANRLLNSWRVSEKIKDAISKHQNDLIIQTSVRMKDDYQKSEEAGVLAWGENMGLNLLGLNFGMEDWRRKHRNELNAMEELLFSIKVEEVIEECIAILKSKKIFVTKSEKRISQVGTTSRGYESKWYINLELNW